MIELGFIFDEHELRRGCFGLFGDLFGGGGSSQTTVVTNTTSHTEATAQQATEVTASPTFNNNAAPVTITTDTAPLADALRVLNVGQDTSADTLATALGKGEEAIAGALTGFQTGNQQEAQLYSYSLLQSNALNAQALNGVAAAIASTKQQGPDTATLILAAAAVLSLFFIFPKRRLAI